MSIENKIIEECMSKDAKYSVRTSDGKYRCLIYKHAKDNCKYYYEEHETFEIADKKYTHTYHLCKYKINKNEKWEK